MYKTNEAIIASLQLLDANGQAASGKTVTATAYDEAYGVFSNPGVSEIGSTGIYYCTFTPDAEGLWTLLFTCADPLCIRAYSWYVQKQVADDIDTLLSRLSAGRAGYLDNLSAGAVALEATLATHDTDIKALLATIAGYIDTEIGAIETKLDTPANFMADVSALALEATLSTHDGDIKTLLAALNDLADSEVWGYATRTLTSHAFPFTNPAAALDVSNIRTAAYGQYNTEMARITANVATEAKQDIIDTNVDDIETDTEDMQPRIPRIVCKMDFWSLPLQVTITSTAGDRGLVDVVVSGLPAGVTIIAVQGMFLCDSVENSFAGVNYLESTKIQVKKKVAGTDRDAITLEANKIFRFTAQMVRGGTILIADWATATDAGILTEVASNTTYQMWFDVGESVQNNIVLDGAQFGLRIWYSV